MKGEENNLFMLKYYDRNARSFLQYLEKTRRQLREEPIHQLRVHIKKMRAILELMEISSQGKFKKKPHFNLFSKFFNHAGNLREIQVNQLIIKKFRHKDVGPFQKYLARDKKQADKKLRKAVAGFDTKRFKKLNGELKPAVAGIDQEKIISQAEKFISGEIKKIKKLMPKLSNPRDLHKIRIRLKSMSAILRLGEVHQTGEKWTRLKKQIKPLELLIGDWHDQQVLATTMKQFVNKSRGNNHEIENVKKLVKRIDRKNEKTVKQVGKRLRLVFSAH